LRQRVQVRRGCGVAGGASSVLRRFVSHVLCRSVSVQRRTALQVRSRSAVGELQSRFDCRARPKVFRGSLLE
jgi:hypothetical protein